MAKVSNAWGMPGWRGGAEVEDLTDTMYIHVTEINSFPLKLKLYFGF